MSEVKESILKIGDKVILGTLFGHASLLILIIFLFAAYSHLETVKSSEIKIGQIYENWEKNLTEVIYVSEMLGKDYAEVRPALEEFQDALGKQGVMAKVQLGACRSTTDNHIVLELLVGSKKLSSCLIVKLKPFHLSDGTKKSIFIGILTLILSGLLWMTFREHLRRAIIIPLLNEMEKNSEKSAIGQIASQVAHDIRSPLAALDMSVSNLPGLGEKKRLMIQTAVNRIRDIVNDLSIKQKRERENKTLSLSESPSEEALKVELVPNLLDWIITEKRTQYRSNTNLEIDYQLDACGYTVFAKLQTRYFMRALSNIIDNSVEALNDGGRIQIALRENPYKWVEIVVEDNGVGMPEEVLKNIGRRGATYGKPSGSGLGLYSAIQKIKSWGGHLQVESQLGQGTKVSVHLPRAESPHWFLPQIELQGIQQIVVVDDDSAIHMVWDRRFETELSHYIPVIHLTGALEFDDWFKSRDEAQKTLYLIDFDFIGEKSNGLDLIKRNTLMDQSVLVTSHFEDPAILNECLRTGIKLLPKSMAGFIPVHSLEQTERA